MRMNARMDYVSKSLHILGATLNYKHTILEQRRIREEDMAQVFASSSGVLYDLRV